MRDGDLPGENGLVAEAGRNVMCEIGVDGREDAGGFWDGADDGKQIDGRFKRTRKEARAGPRSSGQYSPYSKKAQKSDSPREK